MIKIFGQTDRDFSSNGDIVLLPTRAIVHKEDNGDYYLDIESSLDYVDYLVAGNIVVVETPQGAQAFRVGNPIKTRKKITTRCYHVFYDSKNYLISDSYVVDKTCAEALDHLRQATEPSNLFSTSSDISVKDSYRCVRKSFFEAIQTVIERWGGHLVRDNFNIAINRNIGQDNGVTVQYRKNLKEITCEERWEDVVTRLLPVGKDGILLNAIDSSASIYIDSTVQYEIPYCKTVTFSQDDITEEAYTDEAGVLDTESYRRALVEDLRRQAISYLEVNQYPKVNYTLKANLEKLTDIGDTVEVLDNRLGIRLMTRVIAFSYDCILEKYEEVQFGNFKQTLSGLVSTITSTVDKTINAQVQAEISGVQTEIKQATDDIWATLDNSYVIYNGNSIIVVDSLPKESATRAIKIDQAGVSISSAGIRGPYTMVWTIDGVLDMQSIKVVNLVADMINGGKLEIGSHDNKDTTLELYDDINRLYCRANNQGIRVLAKNGSYLVFDAEKGLSGYDKQGTRLFALVDSRLEIDKLSINSNIHLFSSLASYPVQYTDAQNSVNGLAISSIFLGAQ